MKLNEALKEARIEKGYSTLDVQKATGISNQNLSRWEKGLSIPGVDFCMRLADFYGLSMDELTGYPDTINSKNEQNTTIKPQSNAVAFINEFSDIIRENNFINIAKLYKAAPKELRAIILGYLIGLLQSQGLNTQNILNY